MESDSIQKERKELLELITKEAYFKKKTTLSSGKKSDYYIDARLITLKPRGVYLCARLIHVVVQNEKYDAIGGPTLGADPLIGALGVVSLQAGSPKNTFIIRKEAKVHGQGRQIEGPDLKKGAKVIVVDDVATTGKAFLHALEVLGAMNVKALKCVCIVDREEGAAEAVADAGSELVSIFKGSEIHKK